MRTETFIFPSFLASALVNGDTSGLEERDMHWVEVAHETVAPGHIISAEGESYFSRYSDLPGFRLAADVMEFVAVFNDETRE
mgnify:CR=1 FL=1